MGHDRALLSLATGTGKTFIAFNFARKLLATGYAGDPVPRGPDQPP